LTLAYEDTGGDGPVVLFVHGLGGCAYAWFAQLAACGDDGYRALAYDQRGVGRSSRTPGAHSVDQWARDAVALLDALGIERTALVGHSVGCMVAENAVLALGDRAWALALCGGAPEWPPGAGSGFEQRAALARAGRMDEIAEAVASTGLSERCRADRPGLHGLMLALIASNDPESYAEWALATAAGRMRGLGELSCPVLAFAGSEDQVTPPALAEQIAAAARDGRAATVAGAAHWCMLEDPRGVGELLLDFLATATSGGVDT
jgi:pimeloyl-ACP methyl ester carboxylesterase